ncbi:MAG: SGNH/GDSL hydrolase family protein [Acidimicrobiia bacterium]
MGDSYSAGEGVPPYEAGSDEALNRCHRSHRSYPHLLAAAGASHRLRFVACGGARTTHVTGEEQYQGDQPGGQISALRSSGGDGSVASITIGGNDARFGEIMLACIVALLPCSLTHADEARWIDEVVRPLLAHTYAALRAAAPTTRIFVLTYPQIFQTGDECWGDIGISAREKRWIRERTAQLNAVIVAEAESAGLIAVDVTDAFAGHEICTDDPWAFGFFGGDGRFHPNAEGHRVLAEALAERIAS